MAERYRLSFTTGGLFLQEAPLVVERYLTLRDWEQTRQQVRSENLLQVRTASASTRISKELIARLELLDSEELEFLADGNLREQGYLLWAATCRRYAFISDFAREVLREHFLLMRRQLTTNDYDAFCYAKALWHAELDELAASTHSKLRQNLFRMLRDADLVSVQHQIQPAMVTPALASLLARKGNEQLLIFPATDHEIKRWLQ
ncbi:hypothetical protein RT21_21390 [Pseudomonas sp. 10B238]|uniref:DUF1819 family protein n=1 Tax=Pseudomonadaceae TaxID=135621 RepID=UPI000617AFF5|nr:MULTISPECIES: DUF1819 family protein [Pseudomonadaceae]KJJ61213.1 hypothetical protein RT21_21390 [Pseudomonas sp. 10B238]MCH2341805.1 DUF1819 family protein [Pseudomonas sp.]MCQ2029873.1 DUF1819 family protein [Stutzerimonas zhaodongensis]